MAQEYNDEIAYKPNTWHPRAGTCKHYVYELYMADGTCLYVGRTAVLWGRLEAHAVKDWWDEVDTIEIAVCPDFESARDAEKARIRLLDPLYNEQFADTARSFAQTTRRANREARHARGEPCRDTRCRFCRERRNEPA